MNIDAFGKACPRPLMMAKKELDAGCQALSILVDNDTAVENLTRLAQTIDGAISVVTIEGGYQVSIPQTSHSAPDGAKTPATQMPAPVPAAASSLPRDTQVPQGYVVFIGKDHVGEGDPELGATLMKMALYTLAESDDPPAALLFMNAGVKLVAHGDTQCIESVERLVRGGTQALVCGACLDFYGLKETLAVGAISNMYDILTCMKDAPKVISL